MRLAIALLLLPFASVAHAAASVEGIFSFSSLRFEFAGIGSSGKVVVEGQQDDRSRLVSLRVEAFGKIFEVPKEKLVGFSDVPSNGVLITYGPGAPELGGRKIYIQLQMGFSTGTQKQALVTIAESGAIEVSAIELKKFTL